MNKRLITPILAVAAAILGFGAVLGLCLVGSLAMRLFGRSSAGVTASAPTASAPTAPSVESAAAPPNVAAPALSPPVQPASSGAPSATSVSAAPVGNWTVHEDAALGFRAAFPAPPAEVDPLQAAPSSTTDSAEADLAEAFAREFVKNSGIKMISAKSGDRTYSLTAAPLMLGGMPADVYLERVSANVNAMHPGFDARQASVGAKNGFPYRDFTLTSPSQTKLLRMLAGDGFVYSLMIEGRNVSFADADAKRFLDGLALEQRKRPTGQPDRVANRSGERSRSRKNDDEPSPEPSNDQPAAAPDEALPVDEPAAPDEETTPAFTGRVIPFTIHFPGGTPEEIDTLAAIVDKKRRLTTKNLWAKENVEYESFIASHADRRFVVTAWRERSLTGSDATNAQLARFKAMIADMVGKTRPPSAGPPQKTDEPGRPGVKREVYSRWQKLNTGRRAVYQEIRAGEFSFLLQVEGPPDMDVKDDELAWGFFRSLKLPAVE